MENKNNNTKHKQEIHPKQSASIASKLFFCWALPLFKKGFQREISENDLYPPLQSHESQYLGDKLERFWDEELKTRKKPSLWRALIKVFGLETTMFGFVVLIQEIVIKLAQPYFIGKLLSYYVPLQTTVSLSEAYSYAFWIIGISIVNVLIVHRKTLEITHLGMKMRIACGSLMHRKILKLSKSVVSKVTTGEIVNLLANDLNRLDNTLINIHYIWLAPIETIVMIYLLLKTLNPAALAGMLVLILFIPFQIYLGKVTNSLRLKTALATDKRIKTMVEIITGINLIKIYTWEKWFAKLIETLRKLEMRRIRTSTYIKAVNGSFLNFLTRLSIYFCILAYVLTGNQLQAQYVYVITAYYGILRQTLTVWFSRGISALIESNVSIKRLQEFLNSEEVYTIQSSCKEQNIMSNQEETPLIVQQKIYKNIGINMKGVFATGTDSTNYVLNNITINAQEDELIAVIGPVGCGKTTLLNAILREIPICAGNINVYGKISYVAQEPWLFPGTIKDNILFGEEYKVGKYRDIVKLCTLEYDFSVLPHGDQTIIGDRGIILSGGQKARVNLARALYKNADIYLLDDPLSAVDNHVAKKLFENCIKDYLKNKCRILVTNQLQYLSKVDKIYLLENGTITASGNLDDLRNSRREFTTLLENEVISDQCNYVDTCDMNKKDEMCSNTESSDKEERHEGSVDLEVYRSYCQAGGSYCFMIFVIIVFILTHFLGTAADYFVAFWVNIEQTRFKHTNHTVDKVNVNEYFMNQFLNSNNCLLIYSTLIVIIILMTMCRSFLIFKFCIDASKNLHKAMFTKILSATMNFFFCNPSGRILNRFSKDLSAVDESLPTAIIDTFHVAFTVISISMIVAIVNPWILIPSVVIFGIFYLFRFVHIKTTSALKRLEATSRSPIYSHLVASIQGLTTIRASGVEYVQQAKFDYLQNQQMSSSYMLLACNRTFGFWLDINCIIYIALVTLSFLFIGKETYGGNVGLAITQSITLTGFLQWGMRQWSDLENQMTSVERILEYTNVDQEKTDENRDFSENWPSKGCIEFQNVFLKYSLSDGPVLNDLTFSIKENEKIGIVGRTGAGKSSLISTLFRLVEIEGKILIDGKNIKDIPLKIVRSKISVIPQDPILFYGSLRKNLDPLDEYDDEVLYATLEKIELKALGLDFEVLENGSNLSVGQKQLICLARAIIRSNKILVLDEATANVDPQTDKLIQIAIRELFRDCTVLTIAHRLHTVMDFDRILVMDLGRVVEFDSPYLLLQNQNSIFYSLVRQTGLATDKILNNTKNIYNNGR